MDGTESSDTCSRVSGGSGGVGSSWACRRWRSAIASEKKLTALVVATSLLAITSDVVRVGFASARNITSVWSNVASPTTKVISPFFWYKQTKRRTHVAQRSWREKWRHHRRFFFFKRRHSSFVSTIARPRPPYHCAKTAVAMSVGERKSLKREVTATVLTDRVMQQRVQLEKETKNVPIHTAGLLKLTKAIDAIPMQTTPVFRSTAGANRAPLRRPLNAR